MTQRTTDPHRFWRSLFWFCGCLTCVAELPAAHVLGQHGSVAPQLRDEPPVDVDVISAAADTPAEIHLHAV